MFTTRKTTGGQVTRNGVESTVSYSANDEYGGGDEWTMSSYCGDGDPGSITGPNSLSLPRYYDQEDKPTKFDIGATDHATGKGDLPFAPGWNMRVPYNDAPHG